MSKFRVVKGMKDLLPPDSFLWHEVELKVRHLFEKFGYEEIRTPLLESTDLFIRGIGQTTDIVEKEMYTFEDSKGKNISLRPEMTACVVRAYLEHQLNLKKAVHRFFYFGPMFRHERPQAGRLRQFHQFGVELIGSKEPVSDCDVLCLLKSTMDSLGIEGYQLQINSLGSQETKEKYSELLKNVLKDKVSHLCSLCQSRVDRNVFRILDCKSESCSEIVNSLPTIQEVMEEEDIRYFNDVLQLCDSLDINYTSSPRLVRGLDYYTGVVFELKHPQLGAKDAVGAGGRYDNLVASYGGPSIPAVGFAVGVERLFMLLSENQNRSISKPPIYLISLGSEAVNKDIKLLNLLRENDVHCQMSMLSKNLKNQMKEANKIGAEWVLIRGEQEIEENVVQVKNMSTGESVSLVESEVVGFLKDKI